MTHYLSKIRLAHSPSAQALAKVFAPDDPSRRRAVAHNLLWSVFADGPDRRRDFLWRQETDGHFLTLSARPPLQTDLFDPHQVREFAPVLATGDRLEFSLRATATRMKKGGQRVDVVMDALHNLPQHDRAKERMALARTEGCAWLTRLGEKSGFGLLSAQCDDYSIEALPDHRGPRKGQPQFGILDLTGRIAVTDPALFLTQLFAGFGRAKAFGCGMMVIRRTQ